MFPFYTCARRVLYIGTTGMQSRTPHFCIHCSRVIRKYGQSLISIHFVASSKTIQCATQPEIEWGEQRRKRLIPNFTNEQCKKIFVIVTRRMALLNAPEFPSNHLAWFYMPTTRKKGTLPLKPVPATLIAHQHLTPNTPKQIQR